MDPALHRTNMLCLIPLALVVLTLGQITTANHGSTLTIVSDEKLLCMKLMENYTKIGLNGRPVQNKSEPIQVQFGLGLVQMDLDERDKILSTSMWVRYSWQDDYLRWDPKQFGGITTIKIAAAEVWKPDIMLYNTAETDKAEREVLTVVSSTGFVLWGPHQIFKSSCSIDVSNFPFDQQECHMYFGSWTHGLLEINLNLAFPQGIDLSTFMADYKESCSWDIVNHTAERQELPAENPSYVLLAFTLHLQRKMVFSTYILTLPCIFLASLTLVVFWLPPDRPDRTSLAMSIFASFLVLLLILVEAAPPTASSVPLLGVYYCFNMVIIMLSIFLSTLVVNICRCEEHIKRIPPCVRKVMVEYLARVFCLGTVNQQKRKPKEYKCANKQADSSQQLLKHKGYMEYSASENSQEANYTEPFQFSKDLTPPTKMETEIVQVKLAIQHMSNTIISNMNKEEERKKLQRDWKTLALVLDRVFFIIYLFAIIFSLLFLFPRPP